MEFNKNQALGFTSKLLDFETVNKEFTKCKCYMLATGDNVNGSDITLESVQKAMERGEFYNKPVIAHLYQDPDDNNKWRVGGHDSKWVITDTSFEVVNECIPFGTIPESSNLHLEEVLEPDGITKNIYLVCDILLWTGRFNIMDAAYSDDVYFNQSCELSINEYHWKDNDILAIDDFTFSALCLLNKNSDPDKNVRPCFPSCRVEKIKSFSIDEKKFKESYGLMLERLKQYETEGDTSVQNRETNMSKKGETTMDLTKFMNLLSDIKCEGNDCVKYELLSADENKIYVLDKENGYKIYSVDYVMSEDNPVINWNTKTEGDIAFAAKPDDEDSHLTKIFNEINEVLAKQYEADYSAKLDEKIRQVSEEIEANYTPIKEELTAIKESYAVAKDELKKYKEIETEKERLAHIETVEKTLEQFEKKIGKAPEFIYFKAKLGDYENVDIDKLNKDLTLMSGDIFMNSNKNKSFSYNPTSAGVVNKFSKENDLTDRYGHLFDGFTE